MKTSKRKSAVVQYIIEDLLSGRKKPVVMSYWRVPADILENREALAEWADKSIQAAKNAKKPKK